MKAQKLTVMKRRKLLLGLLVMALIGLFGCNGKETTKPAEPTELLEAAGTMEDFARVNEKEDNNWMYIEGEYVDADYIQRTAGRLPQCALAIWDSANKQLTLTFGSDSTTCITAEGNVLQGVIVATHSGQRKQPGFRITVNESGFHNMDGFKINDFFVNANNVMTLLQDSIVNGDTLPRWSIERNYTTTFGDGTTFSFQGTFYFTKIGGAATNTNPNDDIFSITGNGQGTNRQGKAYTLTIIEPLIKDAQCDHIKEGIIELKQGSLTVKIDFAPDGKNTCDNKVRIDVNNGQLVKDVTL